MDAYFRGTCSDCGLTVTGSLDEEFTAAKARHRASGHCVVRAAPIRPEVEASPYIGRASCVKCGWTVQRDTTEQAAASLYRHLATHYDPVDRREDGPGIARMPKPLPDHSVWGCADVDLLCADE